MAAFKENVVVDHDNSGGVATRLHFQDDELIVQKTYDAEPHLDYAKAARDATEGQRWGNGKLVGHLPPAIFGKLLKLPKEERTPFIQKWLKENPKFVMFDRYLK